MTSTALESGIGAMRPVGWWTDAVVYQIYPRSFADANGDGFGDLPGVIGKIPYLADLGADAIWLSPFYPSAGADGGYDVSDPCDVDPLFGTLDDFDRLVELAHREGLRVIVDVVPNHTSSEHPWFLEALAARPGSAARDRYIFRQGRGEAPPNDWESVFGGSAWTRSGDDGDWYLHLFDAQQPDLNWRNPEVREEYLRVLRFWLDRGVDGFRVDVAHGLVKADGLPDMGTRRPNPVDAGGDVGPMWDQDGVHEIYRSWRQLLAAYGDDRILVAEAWPPHDRLGLYVRGDEMHQAFNFRYLNAGWDAPHVSTTIDLSLATTREVGATTTWVTSNHDIVRIVSRLGRDNPDSWTTGIGPDDQQPDLELGTRRARAYALLTLALPGSVYIYQGEELGLPDHTTMPHEYRQDPVYRRTSGRDVGRDGCRVPLPWKHDALGFGFGPSPWLPQPSAFASLAVDLQVDDPRSTLHLFRTALRLRRELALGRQPIIRQDVVGGLLRIEKSGLTVLVNFSPATIAVDEALRDVLLATDPEDCANGVLASNGAVWLRSRPTQR
jgi:alpha-glucosidase